MAMKIFVTGNCQARPLSGLLQEAAGVTALEPAILQLSRDHEAADHLARMETADLILAQRTQTGFSPAHLASETIRARHPQKTLIWPNLFHSGQQPWLRYVTHTGSGRLLGPLDAYHDLRILGDWYQARIGHNPFGGAVADQDPVRIAAESLQTLRAREAECDLGVADLIAAEEGRRVLFFTFNHPSIWLLTQLAARIAAKAGLPFDPARAPHDEPLDRITPPSIWHDWPQGRVTGDQEQPPVRGPQIDLGADNFLRPGPPALRDAAQLRALSFACYDRQADLLRDLPALRLTPHTALILPPASPARAVPAARVQSTQGSAPPRTLFNSDHLVAILHDHGGDLLAVTFAGSGDRPHGNRIWAGSPLQKLGISGLGFTAKAANWYPERDMAAAIAALEAQGIFQRFPRRIGYGTSMGGYAVLRYGARLGLKAGLALSPQVSIDPADITDPRFNQHFDQALHKDMRLAAGCVDFPAAVVCDPYLDIDARHLAQITKDNPVTPLALRGGGHMIARVVAGTQKLASVLEALDQGDVPRLNRHLQGWRRATLQDRALRICARLTRKHQRKALHLFKTHCLQTDPAGWPNIMLPLCQAGLGPQLASEMEIARRALPDSPVLLLAFAVRYQREGRLLEALDHVRHAHARAPGTYSTFLLGQIEARLAKAGIQPPAAAAPLPNPLSTVDPVAPATAATAASNPIAAPETVAAPPHEPRPIARNIMLYWADAAAPPSVQATFTAWRDMFPGWDVQLFSREDGHDWIQAHYGTDIARLFARCRIPAMQADVLRVLWGIEMGGIYSDLTFIPLSNPGLAGLGRDLVIMRNFHGRIVSGIFYAAPGSQDLQRVAWHILRNLSRQRDQNVWSATGPGVWIEALGQQETASMAIIGDTEMRAKYIAPSGYAASTRESAAHWSQDQKRASIYLTDDARAE